MDIANTLTNKAYWKVIIYYYSSTVNSGIVASWFSQIVNKNSIES
jgi:hypothetical protein